MHVNNSCTCSGNRLIPLRLAMLKNKESCHKLTSTLLKSVGDEGLKRSKNDGDGQMLVVFTITELNYIMVSIFCDLVRLFSYLYLWY